jgi:hypothetical protein
MVNELSKFLGQLIKFMLRMPAIGRTSDATVHVSGAGDHMRRNDRRFPISQKQMAASFGYTMVAMISPYMAVVSLGIGYSHFTSLICLEPYSCLVTAATKRGHGGTHVT